VRVEVEVDDVAPDEMWIPTGERVLEILSRRMAGKTPIRFRNQAELDEFRSKKWPQGIPGRFPLWMLVESCHEIGFHPSLRADAVYMVKVRDP
jgi:hypothetical protein